MHWKSWNPGRVAARASIAGLLVVLSFLAGLSLFTQHHTATLSQRADRANRLSSVYQDARFWVSQEESLERKYRLEPSPAFRAQFQHASTQLAGDLKRLSQLAPTPTERALVARIAGLHAAYVTATTRMLDAVDAGDRGLVIRLDHSLIDPVFGEIESVVYRQANHASEDALAQSAALRRTEDSTSRAVAAAFGIGLVLLVIFGLTVVRFRQQLDAAREAEVRRLAEVAITDPLTGLRNHGAFHEDLEHDLHRTSRSGAPLSLVLLDVDGLKKINDTFGHQAGDAHLRAVANAIRATGRAADRGYRVGGDEFAVILDNTRAWPATEFVQRLQASLATAQADVSTSATAGIAETLSLIDKEALIRKADLALINSKRAGRQLAVYTAGMEPPTEDRRASEHQHYTDTLAGALARAVDAKDSYTRSHSQTVSQLCVLIAGQLALPRERIERIRLASLLHDVGKIGVPDAILNKHAHLTAEEYKQIQAHPVLGYEIVAAADLPVEAIWVRHHHERYDGHGYPDGLAGEQIPLESRIILVADAYEAMTSDRPYRRAPGPRFALAELRRHAGSQFDPQVVDALIRAIGATEAPAADLQAPGSRRAAR